MQHLSKPWLPTEVPGQSEPQYRIAFERAPVGLAIAAAGGTLIHVNQALCAMLGYERSELIALGLQAITHPDDRPRNQEEARLLLAGELESLRMEKRYLHRDGRTVQTQVSVAVARDASGLPSQVILHVHDTSGQQCAEQALRESQQSYHALVNSFDGIVWEANASTFGNLFVSRQAERLLGYPTTAWLSSPTFWQDHLHPDDRDRAIAECEDAIRTRQSYRSEYRMIASDGQALWFTDLVTVLIQNGQVIKLRGVMIDITARKLAEQALLETTTLQRAILDSANYTIIGTEPDGTIRHFNAAAEQWLGYRAEEVVGRATPTIIHDPQEVIQRARELSLELGRPIEPGFETFVAKARLGVADENEWTYIRKDGRRFPVRLSVTALRDASGAISGFLGIGSDLSEQQRAEGRLRDAVKLAQDLRFALDESAIVAITDQTGKIQYVNDQFCRISGYARAELLGQDHRIISSGQHPKEYIRELWTTIANGRVWRGELCNRARNGQTYWVDTTIVPFLDPQGRPRQYVAIRYDISERKRAEASLRSFALHLEQSNKELRDFAFVASHDLQEPLRKVQAFGDRLRTRHARQLGPEGLDYLKRMNGAVGRMQVLLHDLLAYSRVTTKPQAFTTVDLGLVAREVLTDLALRLERSGGQVELGELGVIEADATQMRQLLQNLIGNALKFHRQDVPPNVHVRGEQLETPHANAASAYRIVVEDNGIGFEEKYLERIFEPFKRLHSRSTFEGTGIGLAICRKIAERHGGQITAQSEPGRGSSFTVHLPLEQPQPEVEGTANP